MSKYLNNWKPETRALIKSLVTAGCTLVAGDNGEEKFNFTGDMDEFVGRLTECDEAHIFVRTPSLPHAITPGHDGTAWIYLVFGNSPGELASDYICRPEIEAACEAHSKAWEGRKQPRELCPAFRDEAVRVTAIAHALNSNLDTNKLGTIYYCGKPVDLQRGKRYSAREGLSCGLEATLLDYGWILDMAITQITDVTGKQLFPRR